MKKTILLLTLGSFLFTGCPKHEIIPAPVPHVELTSEFLGVINGADVELHQNVNGYYLDAQKTKIIMPSPTPSSAVYSAEMKSSQTLVSIKINLGSVYFDAAIAQDPSLEVWKAFFQANDDPDNPSYTLAGADGFEVVYRDGTGAVWASDPAGSGQTVKFTNVVQESDETGDYVKFLCEFDCNVYRDVPDTSTPDPNDTITISSTIQNASFTGYFKR